MIEHSFHHLTPDFVLTAVEQNLGLYCSNLCRPLNSYINRVYELEDEDGTPLVAKFYRPGRWSQEALREEHSFTAELVAGELPVVAPLQLKNGGTLGCHEGFFFSVFPRKGGRLVDEPDFEQWLTLGRLLGRAHMVGAARPFEHRLVIRPDISTAEHLSFILDSGLLGDDFRVDYIKVVESLIEEICPLFDSIELIRIHGDCHSGNMIYRPDETFYLIDLDDMAMGPAVQDIWMLLPGELEESREELALILEGYETFRSFDRNTLVLIEPLRAMRFVHYTAWCAWQVKEDGFSRIVPDFGTASYWQKEIADLVDQLNKIQGKGYPTESVPVPY